MSSFQFPDSFTQRARFIRLRDRCNRWDWPPVPRYGQQQFSHRHRARCRRCTRECTNSRQARTWSDTKNGFPDTHTFLVTRRKSASTTSDDNTTATTSTTTTTTPTTRQPVVTSTPPPRTQKTGGGTPQPVPSITPVTQPDESGPLRERIRKLEEDMRLQKTQYDTTMATSAETARKLGERVRELEPLISTNESLEKQLATAQANIQKATGENQTLSAEIATLRLEATQL